MDTSVWSLALRRDQRSSVPAVEFLRKAIQAGEVIFTTGLVLQELLQGFGRPRAREQIIARFALLPFIVAERADHIEAADLRNTCRRKGLQVGTIDALLGQLCIRHGLDMLTTDDDFQRMARFSPLAVVSP